MKKLAFALAVGLLNVSAVLAPIPAFAIGGPKADVDKYLLDGEFLVSANDIQALAMEIDPTYTGGDNPTAFAIVRGAGHTIVRIRINA